MKAGRKLDALIAEKVMGYRWGLNPVTTAIPDDYGWLPSENDTSFIWKSFFRPSTDISDAWKVVDKLNLSDDQSFALFKAYGKYDFEKDEWTNPGYEVHINCECGDYDNCKDAVWAETAPLAICMAALKAVGGGDCCVR